MEIEPGLTYLTRADWDANRTIPRLGYTVPRSSRTKAIIHHTVIIDNDATKNLWTDLVEVKDKMRQLQTIRPDLGMDVPYNFVMFLMEDGTIVVCEGRGLDRTGAHTRGHNTDGMATALQGNFMLPTDLGVYIPGMSRWWGWLRYDNGMGNLGSEHPGAIAYGHRDFRDPDDTSTWTSCPGDNLYAIIPQLTFQKALEPPVEEEDMKLIIIKTHSSPTQWVTDGMMRWPFTSQAILDEFAGLNLFEGGHIIITDALMAAIPVTPNLTKLRKDIMSKLDAMQLSGGGGLTAEEFKESMRQLFQEVWGQPQ